MKCTWTGPNGTKKTGIWVEGEFDDSVESFSSMLEPLMIVFLGVVIGFILVAMYQPIFLMGSTV